MLSKYSYLGNLYTRLFVSLKVEELSNQSDRIFNCTFRRMYTASTDKTIGVWDMTTGEKIKKLKGKIHGYRQP